jgi:hypothetical protein
MRKVLPLVLVVGGLPCLAAYAETHKPTSQATGRGKISISRASTRAFLPAPGAAPTPLALRLRNSDDSRRYVTRLTVAVRRSAASCPSAANLRIVQSNVSSRHPLRIRGGGSVTLPAKGVSAPTLQLVDRPVNQDGCKGTRFPLRFRFSERARR